MRRASSPRPSARARGDAPIAPDRVTDRYGAVLDGSLRAVLRVEFTREHREGVDYSVVLLVEHEEELKVVRLYDGAHGLNELLPMIPQFEKSRREHCYALPAETCERGMLVGVLRGRGGLSVVNTARLDFRAALAAVGRARGDVLSCGRAAGGRHGRSIVWGCAGTRVSASR
jgi:hypothetical protein